MKNCYEQYARAGLKSQVDVSVILSREQQCGSKPEEVGSNIEQDGN